MENKETIARLRLLWSQLPNDNSLWSEKIEDFIKSEQSKLLQAILEKKLIDGEDIEIVLVEDIESVAKEWGIEV